MIKYIKILNILCTQILYSTVYTVNINTESQTKRF